MERQGDEPAAVDPDGRLGQQRRMRRQAGGARGGSLLHGGLLARAGGAGIGQAGERQLVLEPLMGFAVRIGTELAVGDSAQKRQSVPAI